MILVATTACTPADPDGPGISDAGSGSGGLLAADTYCEETVDAFCAFYERCDRMHVPAGQSCRDIFLESCNARYERFYAALAQEGALHLSRQGVASCREHLQDVSCDQQIFDLDGPCGNMWVGTRQAGESCGFNLESLICAPGTRCVLGLDLCGTCKVVATEDQSCGGDVVCAADQDCESETCVPRAEVGESCANGVRCRGGARCVEDVCAPRPVAQVGEACGGGSVCAYRSECIGGYCVASGLLGDACSQEAPCASGHCDQAGEGVCAAFLDPGSPCAEAGQCLSGRCEAGQCAELISACLEG
jgi:hypothetical protein